MDAGLGSNIGLVWTQTWEGSLLASVWWSGLMSWGSAGHSLNKQDGAAALWTWAWNWACQLQTLQTGRRDVEHHLSGQEGTGGGARGGEVPARYMEPNSWKGAGLRAGVGILTSNCKSLGGNLERSDWVPA